MPYLVSGQLAPRRICCQHNQLAAAATMNESDFDALNEHLGEVRPLFDQFCSQNGFRFVSRLAIGRYPRIRIEKPGSPKLWFDFRMELDLKGRRFERFSRGLPYELAAGAYIVVNDEQERKVRFQKSIQCFAGKLFDQVHSTLPHDLRNGLQIVESWDSAYLRQNGARVQLRAGE
jgi:hypothetical protein